MQSKTTRPIGQQTGVMTGGQKISFLANHLLPEQTEFDPTIADHAGVRSEASAVLSSKNIQNSGSKRCSQIQHRQRDAQISSHRLRPPLMGINLSLRQAHKDSVNLGSRLMQEGGAHRTIHPAAHGHGNSFPV